MTPGTGGRSVCTTPGRFAHPGIGHLRLAQPLAAVENVVIEAAVLIGALVEAVEQAVEHRGARRLAEAAARDLGGRRAQLPPSNDIVPKLAVLPGALVKAIELAVEHDRARQFAGAGVGDLGVAEPAAIAASKMLYQSWPFSPEP